MVGSVLESRSKVEREGREVEREVEKVVAGTWRSEALVVGRGAWRSEAWWLGGCVVASRESREAVAEEVGVVALRRTRWFARHAAGQPGCAGAAAEQLHLLPLALLGVQGGLGDDGGGGSPLPQELLGGGPWGNRGPGSAEPRPGPPWSPGGGWPGHPPPRSGRRWRRGRGPPPG